MVHPCIVLVQAQACRSTSLTEPVARHKVCASNSYCNSIIVPLPYRHHQPRRRPGQDHVAIPGVPWSDAFDIMVNAMRSLCVTVVDSSAPWHNTCTKRDKDVGRVRTQAPHSRYCVRYIGDMLCILYGGPPWLFTFDETDNTSASSQRR